MNTPEKGPELPSGKTFVKINSTEYDVPAVLKVLREKNIPIKRVATRDPLASQEELASKEYKPSVWTYVELTASSAAVREALKSSEKFGPLADELLEAA